MRNAAVALVITTLVLGLLASRFGGGSSVVPDQGVAEELARLRYANTLLQSKVNGYEAKMAEKVAALQDQLTEAKADAQRQRAKRQRDKDRRRAEAAAALPGDRALAGCGPWQEAVHPWRRRGDSRRHGRAPPTELWVLTVCDVA